MRVLLTGAAGFIGYHTVLRLTSEGHHVVGLDNLNDYYDVGLKKKRLNNLSFSYENLKHGSAGSTFSFIQGDIAHSIVWSRLIDEHFDLIIHFAAQAGVRYTLERPELYFQTNIIGFQNVLEFAKLKRIGKVIYASSSSVYGNHTRTPFVEDNIGDIQPNIYALSKRFNEMMADTYGDLEKISFIGLRFFTVYGPYGRPDMAVFNFVESIRNNLKIQLYNNGNQTRDFTYIDDIVDGIMASVNRISKLIPGSSEIFNLGCGSPVRLFDFVSIIESILEKKARTELSEILKIEMTDTYCSTEKSRKMLNFTPKISIEDGLKKYIEWHTSFYV